MIPYRINSEADAEFTPAARYYESRSPGVGHRFIDAVTQTIERVCEYPQSGTPLEHGYRRALVAGFPYAVMYRLDDHVVVVTAVADLRRRSGYWLDR